MPDKATIEALAVAVAANVPVILWGPPGTGKTATITQLAARHDLPLEVVIAAIREPSDFAGLPVVVGGEVHLAPPRWARHLAEAGRGIVFFDELSTAPPAVQAALLRVPLDRVVGELELPAEIRVVAAANPPEDAAGGWDLAAPTANRFCHLAWHPTGTTIAEGFVAGFPEPTIPTLPEGWDAGVPAQMVLIGSFLNARPSLAIDVPTDPSSAGRAWPSPRSWEMVARLLAAADAAAIGADARALLVASAVGEGPALELLSWSEQLDLPDPEAVLSDPDGFDLPVRGDRAFALLAAVTAAVVARNSPERWERGWMVVKRFVDEGAPDIAAVAARQLARNRPEGALVTGAVTSLLPLLKETGLAS